MSQLLPPPPLPLLSLHSFAVSFFFLLLLLQLRTHITHHTPRPSFELIFTLSRGWGGSCLCLIKQGDGAGFRCGDQGGCPRRMQQIREGPTRARGQGVQGGPRLRQDGLHRRCHARALYSQWALLCRQDDRCGLHGPARIQRRQQAAPAATVERRSASVCRCVPVCV